MKYFHSGLILFAYLITACQPLDLVEFTEDNMTVLYEGKTYHTVQIGSQCWLKENLNVGTRIFGSLNQTNNSTIEKYCYDDNESNCDIYGGIYQWDEAMQYITNEGAQGICPPGWHIPTYTEFQTLRDAVGNDGNALKAIGQGIINGQGTDSSGFSALLAGGRDSNGFFYSLGYYAYFWSSTEFNSSSALNLYLDYHISSIYFRNYGKEDGFGFCVRCLKD